MSTRHESQNDTRNYDDESTNLTVVPSSSATTKAESKILDENSSSSASSVQSSSSVYVDNPCWGSPTECSLTHFLQRVKREECVLFESKDFVALNKPPDLRMDGEYPATVHKLLSYWFPPPSVLKAFQKHLKETNQTLPQSTNKIDADKVVSTDSNVAQSDLNDQSMKDQQAEQSQPHSSNDLNGNLLFQQFIQSTYHRHSDHPDNEMRPCHQLDYATSGVLLVARSKAVANHARKLLESRKVRKAYLAVVSGNLGGLVAKHIDVNSNNKRNSWPILKSVEEVKQKWNAMEQDFRRQGQKRQKETFAGYMPAPALFEQWKAHERQKRKNCAADAAISNAKQSSTALSAVDPATNDTDQQHQMPNKKPRRMGRPPPKNQPQLTAVQWEHVWEQLYSSNGGTSNNNDVTSSENKKERENKNSKMKGEKRNAGDDNYGSEFLVRPDMSWKEVKKLGQSDRFVKAAVVYNDYMRQLNREQVEKEQELLENPGGESSSLASSLPLVFGVQNANNKTANEDQSLGEHDSNNIKCQTFFVCASIAELSKQFTVMLHPEETAALKPPSLLLPPSVEKLEKQKAKRSQQKQNKQDKGNNPTIETKGEEATTQLAFRPSLTQCTIVQYNKNNDTTKVLLEPWSGRRHQLRIHMALLGHAIVGDVTYRRRSGRQGRCGQMCLHAHRLVVPLTVDDDSTEDYCDDGHGDHDDNNNKKQNAINNGILNLEAPDPFV
ncbi:hypothetical protein ACA910_022065 [Epithemia clementina (nom. ined.)]